MQTLSAIWMPAGRNGASCLTVTLVALALGCSGPSVPSSRPPNSLPPLEGMWDYVGDRTNAYHIVGTDRVTPLVVCGDTGTFTFAKTNTGWVGTVQAVSRCPTSAGVDYLAEHATIDSVVVTADRFTFVRTNTASSCADTAVALPGQVAALSGTEQCYGNERFTWHAVRALPLVSVALAPTLLAVPGSLITLDLVMRTASGQRAFGRPIVWTSDHSEVATVFQGDVTGVGVGSATIKAVVEAHTATTNVTVLPPTSLLAVTAGDAFTCALGADQHAYCWGHSVTPTGMVGRSLIPVPVQAAPAFLSINGNQHSVCGVTAAHDVWCWGVNESGQLGIGTTSDAATPARVQSSGQSFTMATSGGRHSCALATDGHAWCWGANDAGQLGTGALTASLVPVAVTGGLTFTTLSAGDAHTCGIVAGGAMYCWGSNAHAQIGDGTITSRSAPTLVKGSHTFQMVSAGFFHTCGIATGGGAWCWGANDRGQFGNGTTTAATSPVPAATGLTLVSLSSSVNYGCGLTVAAEIWCWGFSGSDTWGQLGYGGHAGSSAPVKVSGGLAWSSVATGVYLYSDESTNGGSAAQTCGVTTGGVTWCWGDNLVGQLGNGTRTESYVPVRVAGQP